MIEKRKTANRESVGHLQMSCTWVMRSYLFFGSYPMDIIFFYSVMLHNISRPFIFPAVILEQDTPAQREYLVNLIEVLRTIVFQPHEEIFIEAASA